ncbi:ABC transporter ATP-binding protein [Bogoriella caseilytica]|uniref:ABC-2 type transport system ATP-binding protein n=1 Tax=Bogoriella caseilytica TaxID=56055 RepID=A0A3N2BG91_9MICO|nr:ABC transporter ATP-binding protein [Bogoriella caseilytica]ROR74240.1 ABC-2 type transport system ATP-binding protein [Bogoriella caseilytica]
MPAPASDQPALRARELRKSYGGRDVVRGLSFSALPGAVTAILGPNGAGKTTTIECCEGLRRPDAGTIEVLGESVGPRGYPLGLRHRVGVMLQDGGLPMAPKAGSVLQHFARLHDEPARPEELLERLGITAVAGTSVRRLSGGQRQRLALATALIGRPELVFLDEPSAGLDPQSRLATWDLLREQRTAGVTMLLTTHLMSEAEELADHVVIVDDGAVVAEGTPAELTGEDEVRVTAAADHPDPAGVVAALSARLGDSFTIVARADHVALLGGTPDARTLGAIGSALDEVGYGTASVVSHRRSLEDVFLELTGRRLREESTP